MDNSDEHKSFFKHVFNFDEDSKADIMNIVQYSLLAIIPIVALNKSMQKYVPEADDKKSSVEVGAEIVIQIIVMFIGMLLIHRIITFVPTYSGTKYPDFHIICIVLAVLMITLSLQTKLGEKVSILTDRLYELWNGPREVKKTGGSGQVRVSQPISGQGHAQDPRMSSSEGTAIGLLPNSANTQPMPNYDAMHRADTNPLVGAATPGMSEGMTGFMEPMAANDALGSSSWSSW
jgi:hypothetical protein